MVLFVPSKSKQVDIDDEAEKEDKVVFSSSWSKYSVGTYVSSVVLPESVAITKEILF